MISENRSYFGEFDPFGDYDLIFGAAKLGLKIVDLSRPLPGAYLWLDEYSALEPWLAMLHMVMFAARRIKFT